MKIKSILAVAAVAGLCAGVQAATINYTFMENGQNVTLGSSSVFTVGGVSITAYGVGDTIYAKNSGPGETGLGFTHDLDHEISGEGFIQLDISQLINSTLATIFISSVQVNEAGDIFYSDILGSQGSYIGSVVNADGSYDITSYLSHRYINVSGSAGNVLIAGLTANVPSVPDGGTTVAMLVAALTALGLVRRKLSA